MDELLKVELAELLLADPVSDTTWGATDLTRTSMLMSMIGSSWSCLIRMILKNVFQDPYQPYQSSV